MLLFIKEDSTTSKYSAEDMKNINSFEEWERELILALHDLKENPDKYIKLPKRSEEDEYDMMLDFCEESGIEIKEGTYKLEDLKRIMEGKGILIDWYDYRENLERNIAIKWCEENNIEYLE